MDYQELLKKHRKKPLARAEDLATALDLDRQAIKRIIPHREPFLLVDRITGLDLEEGLITGSRYLAENDPVFQGHFPDFPIYPGSLEIEMIGQLGLCLHYFILNRRTSIGANARPASVRATRILGAHFLEPLRPGREILLIGKKLDYDDFFATLIGQAITGGKVCCVSIGEVCLLD